MDQLCTLVNVYMAYFVSGVSSGLLSLSTLREEFWRRIVLRGLGSSFQHIRNGYDGAEKQDAAALEHLLDSNDAVSSAAGPQGTFIVQASPPSPLPCLSALFDCISCETNVNHFTEYGKMQRSKERRKANRAQPKAGIAGEPQQAKAADIKLAEFACEASRVLSPSDLITNRSWNLDTRGHMPNDATQRVTHLFPTPMCPRAARR